jgi:hypothetical protein
MSLLTERDRKESTYLGDGLYMLDDGWRIELFASDGIMKNDRVYLDNDVIETLLMLLEKRKK